MGWSDVILMGLIVGGALYLLYHSLWKRKGHCPGCPDETCGTRRPPRRRDRQK